MYLFQEEEARVKACLEMSEERKAAFEKMRFYKFYPVQTQDSPNVSQVKVTQHIFNVGFNGLVSQGNLKKCSTLLIRSLR